MIAVSFPRIHKSLLRLSAAWHTKRALEYANKAYSEYVKAGLFVEAIHLDRAISSTPVGDDERTIRNVNNWKDALAFLEKSR